MFGKKRDETGWENNQNKPDTMNQYQYTTGDTSTNASTNASENVFEPKEPVSSNLLLGLIGAIIGGLISSIPWIILYQMGFIASICGFLSALLVIKGYMLLGKGMDKKGIVISIIVLILTVFFAEIAALTISVFGIDSFFVSNFFYVLSCMSQSEVAVAVFEELGMSYLFAVLGSFSYLKQIIKSM